MTSATSTSKELIQETSDAAAEEGARALRPVERALDLIGARWTLILIRHLLVGPHGFQELRELTGITPRLLSVRLTEMIDQGFVKKVPFGNRAKYALSDFGKTLEPIVRELALWWLRHAMPRFGPPQQGANPATVFEAISYLVRRDQLADADARYDLRLTVREDGGWSVDFTDAPKQKDSTGQPMRALDSDITSEDIAGREAERLSGVSATAADAGSRGAIVWHPMPYRPDRN